MLLQLGYGAPLLALNMMKQGAVITRHSLLVDLTAIFRGQKTPIQIAARWSKLPLEQILIWWYHWLTDLIRLKLTTDINSVYNIDIIKLLEHVSVRTSVVAVYTMLDSLQQHLLSLKQNPNAQLLCEDILFQWQALTTQN